MNQSKGLGDIVESILKFFGIKAKDDCGCEERKSWLNAKFPLKIKNWFLKEDK